MHVQETLLPKASSEMVETEEAMLRPEEKEEVLLGAESE